MFGVGLATRIYLAAGATDMRKGFEGLYGLVRDQLQLEPLSGHIFIFSNATAVDCGFAPSVWRRGASAGRRRKPDRARWCSARRNWRYCWAVSIWRGASAERGFGK